MKKIKLIDEDKELISNELENLEKFSSAELVLIVVERSGGYKLASAMFSIFILFFISLFLVFFSEKTTFELLQLQLIIFISSYLILENFKESFLKFIPKSYKHQIASENANRKFLKLSKKREKEIMFFVSFDEEYIEIVANNDILEHIPASHWQLIIDEFIVDIKKDKLSKGYLKAIKACTSILIEKFPK